jgi:small conductance mechanosensitive channel
LRSQQFDSVSISEMRCNYAQRIENMNFDLSGVWAPVRDMAIGFLQRLPYIAVALLIFAVFWFLGSVVRDLTQRAVAGRDRARSVGLVLGRLVQGLMVFLGLMIALVIAVPNFRPGDLAQLLGIGTVAVGFAFRDILQNFLAGILLLLSEPFRIGDQIVVGNFEGTVEDIQTRATFIRTYDGRRVVIPNTNLFTQSVTVNTAFDRRRLEYEVRVSGDNNISEVEDILSEAVRNVEGVLQDPAPDVLVVSLDSGVLLRVRWWVAPPRQADRLILRDRVLRHIQTTLREKNVVMPVSTQQVVLRNLDETNETPAQDDR